MASSGPAHMFIRAFNERDLEAFAEVLDAEVELHSGGGLRRGIDEAVLWATRAPGGVQQTIVLEQLHEEGDRAVALIRRVWHWAEDGSPAHEDVMAWLFEFRDRRVLSWRPYGDREEALAAGGFIR
jgi:limonene-1,2-epoxide hydrolase